MAAVAVVVKIQEDRVEVVALAEAAVAAQVIMVMDLLAPQILVAVAVAVDIMDLLLAKELMVDQVL
jgi:hypothetical protein